MDNHTAGKALVWVMNLETRLFRYWFGHGFWAWYVVLAYIRKGTRSFRYTNAFCSVHGQIDALSGHARQQVAGGHSWCAVHRQGDPLAAADAGLLHEEEGSHSAGREEKGLAREVDCATVGHFEWASGSGQQFSSCQWVPP